ncbi:Homeobox domain-containing protein [Caenorhabditis elegans]|uniref:Homeobox domain-containing protein n=1 Tax=Caenorhabditis elegans TaxID=6239 RepID=Q86DC2_CAEEL|nr:Homeobox domain-containing protein [Caenorhabditis elegans]CCD62914.1 Homeobox domain-containing protein [Caenorhabditis elegans]|eukprot:NP_508095.5 C. Elegans Homeobox [Caenorhabditis elegans]
MNRSNEFEWKIPKLEEPENIQDVNLFEETEPEKFTKGYIKEELPDKICSTVRKVIKIPRSALEKVGVRLHDDEQKPTHLLSDDIKTEPIEEATHVNVIQTPSWKPKFQCISDLLKDDTTDFDCEMSLGSSVLFDRPDSSLPIKKICPGFPKKVGSIPSNKRIMSESQVRRELNASFARNCHPTAIGMQKLSERCGIRYKTIFDNFETIRKDGKIECETNDACCRIREFLSRETDTTSYIEITNEVQTVLEDEIELHLLSRKRFTLGYVHVIMEKTDLAPSYIRAQYENWRRKLSTKDRGSWKIGDSEAENSVLSAEVSKQLEEAFLQRTNNREDKTLRPKDIKALSTQLEINEKEIENWIAKKTEATSGSNSTEQQQKHNILRIFASCRRRLPKLNIEGLNKYFAKNNKPGVRQREKIAKKLGLSERQVRNYFNKKRITERKLKVWKDAPKDFLTLSKQTVDEMMKIAEERRKPNDEYIQIANRLGVSHITLCSFIDWQKSIYAGKAK